MPFFSDPEMRGMMALWPFSNRAHRGVVPTCIMCICTALEKRLNSCVQLKINKTVILGFVTCVRVYSKTSVKKNKTKHEIVAFSHGNYI